MLRDKVSEERIGSELDKMLEGNNPHKAVADLHRLGLLPLLFKLPRDLITEAQEMEHLEQTVHFCDHIQKVFSEGLFNCPSDAEYRKRVFYTALMQPFYKY